MASVQDDSWFYLVNDQPVGPVTGDQLRAAVSAGVVGRETMVHHASWPAWCQAGQVAGLFAAAAPAVAAVASGARAAVPVASSVTPIAQPAEEVVISPPSVLVGPAAGLNVQSGAASQKKSPGSHYRRKKSSSAGVALLCLGVLVACGLTGAVVWVVQANQAALANRPAVEEPDITEGDAEWARSRRPRRASSRDWETDNTPLDVPDWNPNPQGNSEFNPTFEKESPVEPRGRLDELVFAKWKALGIEPANLCSDAVFLRRVYLDLIGTLPTAEEARTFLKDESPDKRAKLIDALLERPEYADYWTLRWCDIFRVKAEFPINLWPNAAQAYHRWIHHAIATNMPYDQFVRELLTTSGSNFRAGQVNFYRAMQSKEPQAIAKSVALAFMGSRVEKWPQERLDGMAAFFAHVGFKGTREWKEEIIFFDPHKTAGSSLKPVFPDGTAVEIAWGEDPRCVFADWLITPENPWFTRQIANRIWYWIFGRGIVHEADDIRPDNPPANPELLNWLAEELVKSNYDMKQLCRLILNSTTYQLSPIPKSDHPQATAHFASYPVRRLEAELIIDALNQVTGTVENYSSIIPEPYTFIPETRRAIALPDGSISSSFLELFGKPPRDTGLQSERNNNITAGQRLHLLNSSHIRNKITKGEGIKELMAEGNSRENLYLAILSRFPDSSDGGGSGSELAWMLVNTTEFLFRH